MTDLRDGRQLILIDGRSGSGKSQWAAELSTQPGVCVVSLDEIYPGWDGLDAGQAQVYSQVILPWLRGQVARVRRWDWSLMARSGEIEITPDWHLVIEGCGALSRHSARHATMRYWLEAETEVRRQRALERDGEMFRPHWTRWALQEERFYALHRSRELADSIIST